MRLVGRVRDLGIAAGYLHSDEAATIVADRALQRFANAMGRHRRNRFQDELLLSLCQPGPLAGLMTERAEELAVTAGLDEPPALDGTELRIVDLGGHS